MRPKYQRLSAALSIALTAASTAAASPYVPDRLTFTNPLLPSGPDPWVLEADGWLYYTHTLGDRIDLWRTRDIADLARAERRTVWRAPGRGANAHSIWAPELHRIGGRWFIYYSATAEASKDDADRAVFVLENAAADPFAGEWTDRGRVNTARAGIDGTVFADRGTLWFAYSPYLPGGSGIAIARMANPWTIAGREAVIARPDRAWEDRGGRRILEGPAFLKAPDGRLFLSYSAGACWSDDYALGMLAARPGGNLLDPATWAKHPRPVLKSANGVFATGHNGFFRSPDQREQWIIYHANPAAGMGCTQARAPHIGRVTFPNGGWPMIEQPQAIGTRIPAPGPKKR